MGIKTKKKPKAKKAKKSPNEKKGLKKPIILGIIAVIIITVAVVGKLILDKSKVGKKAGVDKTKTGQTDKTEDSKDDSAKADPSVLTKALRADIESPNKFPSYEGKSVEDEKAAASTYQNSTESAAIEIKDKATIKELERLLLVGEDSKRTNEKDRPEVPEYLIFNMPSGICFVYVSEDTYYIERQNDKILETGKGVYDDIVSLYNQAGEEDKVAKKIIEEFAIKPPFEVQPRGIQTVKGEDCYTYEITHGIGEQTMMVGAVAVGKGNSKIFEYNMIDGVWEVSKNHSI